MSTVSTLKHIDTFTKSPMVSRNFDPYVLCSLKVEQESSPTLLYWKLQNEKQMVEIGIDSITGEFSSMAVILYAKPFQFSKQEDTKTIFEGIPVFSKNTWEMNDPYNNSAYYSIQSGDFEIHIAKNNLWVKLFPDPIEYYVGLRKFFLCGFTEEGKLISIVIENLKEDERRQIGLYEEMWKNSF